MRPTVLVCAPTDASADELDSLREALRKAGSSSITIAPEPLAAAAGAGLDVRAPYAQLLVDVGEGVTDVAVIREGRIEASLATRSGCSDLRSAVADQVAIVCDQLPSEDTIDELIRQADASEDERLFFDLEDRSARGMSRRRRATVERETVLAAMEPILNRIAGAVRAASSRLPEQTAREVMEKGAWLTGGGARLRTLVERVARTTPIEVRVPASPLRAVIVGASRMALSCSER
jgi:rod shape-determining protein MreB